MEGENVRLPRPKRARWDSPGWRPGFVGYEEEEPCNGLTEELLAGDRHRFGTTSSGLCSGPMGHDWACYRAMSWKIIEGTFVPSCHEMEFCSNTRTNVSQVDASSFRTWMPST